jgi:hypothetical protein
MSREELDPATCREDAVSNETLIVFRKHQQYKKTLWLTTRLALLVCIIRAGPKVGVLRASHKFFNSEVRICWNDASKFSSISSSQLTFCYV